jgi:hypothetical protein
MPGQHMPGQLTPGQNVPQPPQGGPAGNGYAHGPHPA